MDHMPTILRIEAAIGRTCYWWSALEHLVHDICLHLASCLSVDFEKSINRTPLHIALSNMDIRDRIATAKAFASQAPTANKTFYNRFEKLLNRLDNELRIERNRYVHDLWMIGDDDQTIERFQQRTIVTRPQSHKPEMHIGTKKPFASVEEVEAFTHEIEAVWRELVEIDNETCTMFVELKRLEALQQSTLAGSESSSRHVTPEQDKP